MQETKCGYVALMGRPNMGKSTLLNALVGQKIAGVSHKPQTTRNRILGIGHESNCQILYLDTPGIHRSQKAETFNSLMNREAWSVVAEADLVLYLVDCLQGWSERDDDFFPSVLEASQAPVMVLLTKVDRMKRAEAKLKALAVEEKISAISERLSEEKKKQLLSVSPRLMSAKDKKLLETLNKDMAERLPLGAWLYDSEDLTDRSQNFVLSELIREKIFRLLGDELPYHTAVTVEHLVFEDNIYKIGARIIVSRPTHKAMVIGKKGSKIKEIGSQARVSLEQHFGSKVYLELEVVVDKDWTNDLSRIAEYSKLDPKS